MSDYISRQAAIEALKAHEDETGLCDWFEEIQTEANDNETND